MICSDPIADMLTRIRNAILVRKKTVSIPHSKIKEGIARILRNYGFILDFSVEETEIGRKNISVKLKYVNREPAILGLKRESGPGRRIYVGSNYRNTNRPQHSIFILSTSSGIMSHKEAKEKKIGGELLCVIW